MAEKTGYTYYADPQQVDFTLRMTVPALANEVLNTAGVDAQRKGFGIDKLNKENRSWVLSRMAIEIDDRPEQYSSYEIVTWVNEYNRMLSTRNFTLHDAAGLALLAGLDVAGHHVDALDHDLGFAGNGAEHLALLALVLAGQNDDLVVLLDLQTIHVTGPP